MRGPSQTERGGGQGPRHVHAPCRQSTRCRSRTWAPLASRLASAPAREEVTCVCKSWHDSCWVVHSGTCAGAPETSPLTGRTVVSSLSCALGERGAREDAC